MNSFIASACGLWAFVSAFHFSAWHGYGLASILPKLGTYDFVEERLNETSLVSRMEWRVV